MTGSGDVGNRNARNRNREKRMNKIPNNRAIVTTTAIAPAYQNAIAPQDLEGMGGAE
jgi:hypothetical protein